VTGAGRCPEAAAGRRRGAAALTAVVMLLAVVVGVGGWLQQRAAPGELPAAILVVSPVAGYPVELDGTTVVAGRPAAPVTIDVYEDYLCPGCAELADRYGERLVRAAASGRAVVRHHPVAMLDGESEPEGYSSRAAVAALCAARTGIFPAVHASLLATPPVPASAGWTGAQLAALGRALGAGDGFARCLRDDGVEQRVAAATRQVRQRIAALRGDGLAGIPTVLVDGDLADPGHSRWLDRALGVTEQ
jgi:protein-disulfide isomerase